MGEALRDEAGQGDSYVNTKEILKQRLGNVLKGDRRRNALVAKKKGRHPLDEAFARFKNANPSAETDFETWVRGIAKARRKTAIAAGRYTLQEAARTIERQAGERYDVMLAQFVDAVEQGMLPTFEPGSNVAVIYVRPTTSTGEWRFAFERGSGRPVIHAGPGPGRLSRVRDSYEEVRWSDLNHWLERRSVVAYRFPRPKGAQAGERQAMRTDILTPPINAAVAATDGSTDAVFAALREAALREVPPFNGVDGRALRYTKSTGATAALTRDALAKRLERRSGKAAQRRRTP